MAKCGLGQAAAYEAETIGDFAAPNNKKGVRANE